MVFAGCTFADFAGDHAAGVSDGATMSLVDTLFLSNHLTSLYAGDDDSHLSVLIADVGFSGIGSTAVRLPSLHVTGNPAYLLSCVHRPIKVAALAPFTLQCGCEVICRNLCSALCLVAIYPRAFLSALIHKNSIPQH